MQIVNFKDQTNHNTDFKRRTAKKLHSESLFFLNTSHEQSFPLAQSVTISNRASYRSELQDDNTLIHRLIVAKDRGGLVYPAKIFTKRIPIAQRYIRASSLTSGRFVSTPYYQVVKVLGPPPPAFQHHATDTQHTCGTITKLCANFMQLRKPIWHNTLTRSKQSETS